MIIHQAKFELTAVRPGQFPTNGLPEIAFAGRSNVGKSSIINSLVNRKSLARVGATPGMTREINYYNVDDRIYFVDLPGYGFANVSKVQKKSWSEGIESYLSIRNQLKLILLLVDIRHDPSKDDRDMHHWLKNCGLPYLIVANKADKISRGQIENRLRSIRAVLGAADAIKIIPFSAETKQGRDVVLVEIEAVLEGAEKP